MIRLYQAVFVCYICILIFILLNFGEASENKLQRQKRYLSFRNNSKFFLRFNFKANMVPWNQIFAQAIGYRVNWEEPPDTFHPYHHLRVLRSTMYSNLETLFDRHKISGYHCVRRAICELNMIDKPRGIYHKILKIIFRKSKATDKWHNVTSEDCESIVPNCPLSILEASLYTDL